MILIKKTQYCFSKNSLIESLNKILSICDFDKNNQIPLSSIENQKIDDSCTGNFLKKSTYYPPSSFQFLLPIVKNTYFETVIHTVGWNCGRIRLMKLPPKSCYSIHVDDVDFRYHIPIVTNDQCFIIYKNHTPIQMSETGFLYKMNVREPHSAMNGGNESRIHLLFDYLPHLD
jgi:hypothetical protein